MSPSLPPSLPTYHHQSVVSAAAAVRQEDGALCTSSPLFIIDAPSVHLHRTRSVNALDARMWYLRSHPPDCNVELFPKEHLRWLRHVELSRGFPSEALIGQPCVPR